VRGHRNPEIHMATDDGGFLPTDDLDWFDWLDRFIIVFQLASQRISLALAAGGFAIAGSNLLVNQRTTGLGWISLGIAGVFVVWFVSVNLAGGFRSRS
jgi:hypothetical protein